MTDGSDAGLDEFIRTEHGRLVGLLSLQVGRVAVAEELAQDAFVRLCQHWPRVAAMEDRRAWLNRVAINLANSALRRRYAEIRANRRHGAGSEYVDSERADVVAVREAVAALPPRQRTVVVLRFYEHLSVAETATAMSCAEGTVKSLTHKAVSALRTRGLVESTRSSA